MAADYILLETGTTDRVLLEDDSLLLDESSTAGATQYVMAGTAASVALSASGANFKTTMPAATGALALAAQPALFNYKRNLVGATGALALSASGANFSVTLPAQTASLLLSGKAATFRKTTPLVASTAALALSGTPTAFNYQRRMSGAAAGLALGAGAATFRTSMPAQTGALALVGVAANLRVTKVLPAATGALALSASSTNFAAARKLIAASSALALSSSPANLRPVRVLTGDALPLNLSGSGANFGVSMPVSPGSLALAANPAVLTKFVPAVVYPLTATVGQMLLSGNGAGATFRVTMPSITGELNLAGSAGILVWTPTTPQPQPVIVPPVFTDGGGGSVPVDLYRGRYDTSAIERLVRSSRGLSRQILREDEEILAIIRVISKC
jgi:hypothetical protein